jgi:inorganic pyrophosphatase
MVSIPSVEVEAIVEIPRGSRNKYELDHTTGEIWLDRLLFTATQYPADYGFIPHTLADDDDPLDVLVLLDEPTFPGCHIRVRVVGVFQMRDEKGTDCKVLAVPSTDPRWKDVDDLTDVSEHLLAEIGHFFTVYKELEPGKGTEVIGWADAEVAASIVDRARQAAGES